MNRHRSNREGFYFEFLTLFQIIQNDQTTQQRHQLTNQKIFREDFVRQSVCCRDSIFTFKLGLHDAIFKIILNRQRRKSGERDDNSAGSVVWMRDTTCSMYEWLNIYSRGKQRRRSGSKRALCIHHWSTTTFAATLRVRVQDQDLARCWSMPLS